MRKYPDYVFKIQRLSDGKYSNGGFPPRFGSFGKVWATYGYLLRHLKDLGITKMNEVYESCRLFVLVEVNGGDNPITIEDVFYELETEEMLKKLNGK